MAHGSTLLSLESGGHRWIADAAPSRPILYPVLNQPVLNQDGVR